MSTLPSPRPSRSGTTTVEALVALLLTAFLLQAAWSLTAAIRRVVARLVERSEALDTERIGWQVLSAEVGAGLPSRDWWVEGEGTLPLRAFRGTAEVCEALASPEGAVVRYRGMRLPDPEKDSLLLLVEGGSWQVARLVAREPIEAGCGGWAGGALERWSWEPPAPRPLLARLFERGSYHLEDGALRYRIGAGGRQPLTPERLDDRASGLRAVPGGPLELRLRVIVEGGVAHEWSRVLSPGGSGG